MLFHIYILINLKFLIHPNFLMKIRSLIRDRHRSSIDFNGLGFKEDHVNNHDKHFQL